MKIQIDTVNKKIKLVEVVNINDLFVNIKKMLPDNVWKEYELETNCDVVWANPVIIKNYPTTFPLYPQPYYPNNEPFVTWCNTNGITNDNGIYNVQF